MNFYKHAEKCDSHNPEFMKQHRFKLPFRMAVIGGSGSGKTNTLLNIIERMPNTFSRIVLCIKDSDEPLYNLLKSSLDPDALVIYEGGAIPRLDNIAEECDSKGKKGGNKYIQQLIVFDDLCLQKDQSRIAEYYIRARKKNISCVYLSQSYYKIPKEIRLQLGYMILKKQSSKRDLAAILRETTLPIDLSDLLRAYNYATQSFEDFFLIDIDDGIFKTFELEPIVLSGEMKDVPVINRSSKEFGELKLDSAKDFVETLKSKELEDEFKFVDLYDAYKRYCKTNNLETCAKMRFGKVLNDVFARRKQGTTTYYQL
jgi:ABC-type dipeptide/oligopeptide/nickel transport system ATPase component